MRPLPEHLPVGTWSDISFHLNLNLINQMLLSISMGRHDYTTVKALQEEHGALPPGLLAVTYN